jgi:hypothetical protein
VVSATEQSETDIYGTDKYTQLQFSNGDKWNLTMMSRKDLAEIKDIVSRHNRALSS